jgi:hypothetical protein
MRARTDTLRRGLSHAICFSLTITLVKKSWAHTAKPPATAWNRKPAALPLFPNNAVVGGNRHRRGCRTGAEKRAKAPSSVTQVYPRGLTFSTTFPRDDPTPLPAALVRRRARRLLCRKRTAGNGRESLSVMPVTSQCRSQGKTMVFTEGRTP